MIRSLLTAISVSLYAGLSCAQNGTFSQIFQKIFIDGKTLVSAVNLAVGSLGNGHRQGIILAYMALGLLPLFLMLSDQAKGIPQLLI